MEQVKTITIRGIAVLVGFLWLLPSAGRAGVPSGVPIPPGTPLPPVAAPTIINVDCNAGKTIQAAVNSAQPGDTLLVSGTCNENVVIPEEVHRITLDGQGIAVINGGPAASTSPNVTEVRGAGVIIKGFTITGGADGIIVIGGGTATIDSNTIRGTGRFGISVNRNGFARITSNTIENNPNNSGISIRNNSSAAIGFEESRDARVPRPNTIQFNGGNGIDVTNASSADIGWNIVSNNTGRGILVQRGAQARIGDQSNTGPSSNTIQQNGSDGIRVSDSSQANIAGNTIIDNKGNGVFVNANSSAAIFADIGPTPNTIQQNGLVTARRDGIQVTSSSSAFISGNTIDSNTGHGVRVVRTSHASIGGNAINNSGLDGIRLEENSGVNLDQANSGSNGNFGLRCRTGAYATGSIGTLTGTSGQKDFGITATSTESGSVKINSEGCIDKTF